MNDFFGAIFAIAALLYFVIFLFNMWEVHHTFLANSRDNNETRYSE